MDHRSLRRFHTRSLLVMILFLAAVVGCTAPTAAPPTPTQNLPDPVVETPTSQPPTPTSIPLALQVNGEAVSLAEYEQELARLQAAETGLGITSTPEVLRERVLDELTNTALLSQAAFEEGFTLSDAALQARIDQLASQMGGSQALTDWQNSHGYTPESFQAALRRAAAAVWQRDQIYADVPTTAEQVHARQILVYNQADAERALSRLVSGADFATLAFRYDPISGGDLGWFPRGFLTSPEVEEVVFALQPGEVSALIESQVGFHIVQLIERDEQRPLNPDAHLALQKNALLDWLDARRSASQVTVTLP